MGPMLEAPSPQMIAYETIVPSRSLDPDPSAVTSSRLSTDAGLTESTADGARLSIETLAVAVALAPSSSVTVSVTVYNPSFVYSWVAIGPGLEAPSPHAMEYEAMPRSSVDPEPSAVTSSNVRTLVGDTMRTAVGGTRAVTRIVAVAVAVAPSSSVTVRVTR